MKINKLLKIVMIILLAIMLVFAAVPVKATDEGEPDDLDKILNSDSDDDEESDGGQETDDGEEDEDGEYEDYSGDEFEEGSDDEEDDEEDDDDKQVTSTYEDNENKDLPKAGIEEWNILPVIVGICIISGVYAIKKIKDYQNI